jgi:hypothetical protein
MQWSAVLSTPPELAHALQGRTATRHLRFMPPTPESSTHPVWPYFAALAVIALLVFVIPMVRGRLRMRREEQEARRGKPPFAPQQH